MLKVKPAIALLVTSCIVVGVYQRFRVKQHLYKYLPHKNEGRVTLRKKGNHTPRHFALLPETNLSEYTVIQPGIKPWKSRLQVTRTDLYSTFIYILFQMRALFDVLWSWSCWPNFFLLCFSLLTKYYTSPDIVVGIMFHVTE